MSDPFPPGEPVLVRGYSGIDLHCVVVADAGGPQVLVRHEPVADRPFSTTFLAARVRLRSAAGPSREAPR